MRRTKSGMRFLQEYRNLAQGNSKVKAIGEIGLDYHYEDVPRQQQILCFREQMALARELDLPVIIHEREAHEDALQVLADFPQVTGVFHCYSGSAEMARRLVSQGWYIGFTGVITFKNARKLVETAMAIPLDRMVIETDCPYMAPEPFRGRRNDPGYVYRMSEKLAELRGISPEKCRKLPWKTETAVPLELGGSMLTQNQIYTALITDYTAQGQGVAHIEGCAVFVPNAIAGELCDIQITKAAKTWAAGRIYKILEVSPAPGKPGLPPEQALRWLCLSAHGLPGRSAA